MKKTLRSIALAALAVPMIASAQFTVETVWANVIKGDAVNPIPGLHPKWQNPTSTTPEFSNSRFAFGKDGKVYTLNNLDNSIVSWDGSTLTKVADLPATTAEKWIGTAIAGDDAGNIIVNFCFTDATKSIQEWGILTNGVLTEVTLSTPLESLGTRGRLDAISHIVGDVTSEDGGIGYATTQKSGSVIMFHFTGDGSKVTSVSAISAPANDEINSGGGLNTPTPKYFSVEETFESLSPETEFYCAGGTEIAEGALVTSGETGLTTLTGFGNHKYLPVAAFEFNGKKYIVRTYTEAEVAASNGVMTFGVFDSDTKDCVAKWLDSDYYNMYGMGSLTAEVVDDQVNIYTWAVTESGDTPGCYAAMVKLTDKTTGIIEIANDENVPVEYFNFQGIRVNQPAAGSIVIKKQGAKTSKFVVR